MLIVNQVLDVVHENVLGMWALITDDDRRDAVFAEVFVEQGVGGCFGGTVRQGNGCGVTREIVRNDQDILIVSGSTFEWATVINADELKWTVRRWNGS
jgi:hypothetical protein